MEMDGNGLLFLERIFDSTQGLLPAVEFQGGKVSRVSTNNSYPQSVIAQMNPYDPNMTLT